MSTRRLRLSTVGLAAALVATGCTHANSSATCGDYKKFSVDNRIKAVKSLLKDHGKDDSTLNIDEVRASVSAYCFTHASSDKIAGIYG